MKILLKKMLAFPAAYALFGVGHLLWKLIDSLDLDIYSFYSWLMVSSLRTQTWANLKGPWIKYDDSLR